MHSSRSPEARLAALRMVATVSNRARTTAAALGFNVDAILAQHVGQILSVKDVEAYAASEQCGPPSTHAPAQAQPLKTPTAITPTPMSTARSVPRPAASSASPPEGEDPLLLDGCRLEIMWPQSKVMPRRDRTPELADPRQVYYSHV